MDAHKEKKSLRSLHGKRNMPGTLDYKPFKLDIDDLIDEFAKEELTTLADMKRVWLSKKFSFIFEACPTTNLACFMQTLYAHSIGYLASTDSLSHRLGGLYCLYCLHEIQPFKPPFRIYLALGELKRLKDLVIDSKKESIKVVTALVKSMLERNMFLFGYLDTSDGSMTKRLNELKEQEDTRVKVAQRMLFANSRIEHFLHMDLGAELDVDSLKKMSTDYAAAKELAIKEAGKVVDVQNIKHLAENQRLIGDTVEKTAEEWNTQKELFYEHTGCRLRSAEEPREQGGNETIELEGNNVKSGEKGNNEKFDDHEIDDDFGLELEQVLSLPYKEGIGSGED